MTKNVLCRGARLLATWIGETPQTTAAERLGVNPMHLNHWLRGRRRPGLRHALAIEKLTDGAVPAGEWLR